VAQLARALVAPFSRLQVQSKTLLLNNLGGRRTSPIERGDRRKQKLKI
jgi:hypothetical protein